MADDLAVLTAEAYLSGWALSEGPFTGRVQAGCAAAVSLALERPDDPRVLELSLHLGHLEGTWATVFRRREEMQARHVRDITAAWRKLVKRLDVRDVPAIYRRELVMGESADPKPSQRQRNAAKAALLTWLQQILTDPGYADLATVIADAMAEAVAEGSTSALALAADQAGERGFDWNKAYEAMRAAVTDSQTEGAADAVTQAVMRSVAADAGRTLAQAASAGASDEETEKALEDSVEAEDAEAPALAVDTASSGFWGQGSIALAMSEGILLNFMTAGDGRVCAACQDCEDNGPYDPADFPDIPQHPRCRCCSSPASPLPISAFAAFLVPAA